MCSSVAANRPEAIVQTPVSAVLGFKSYEAIDIADRIGLLDRQLEDAEACVQRANAFCTQVDRYLLVAQGLCNAMNSSESIRELFQRDYIEKKTVDSMQHLSV